MTLFTGAGVAMVTPFKDGKVDFPSLSSLIDWQISEGTDAIIICGTTGEASTLNDKEHIKVVKYTVEKVKSRVPVIAGAGSNDTAHAIYMSKELEKSGADGLLLVTPYYNKCTQKGLIDHYHAVADSIDIPIILYSVAGRTGVNISPSTVFELAKHPNIVGIKEASGNMSQVVEIAKCVSPDFGLYSGNDDMIVPLLSVGGCGAISTVANVAPKDTHNMVIEYLNGNIKESGNLQLKMKHLIDAMFVEVNPIPVKAALSLMGKLELEYRMPLCPPSDNSMEIIEKEMKDYGLI
ncbi:4-hydroxy-tetrahydrodipicolinate synthase [Anaerovorax odorimutans]|uniref:4-hydroxy-tetrahydrodipicolinate synthase n=1 Tax=Anaerovorax odorimutans TaxID=109327 RepID=UPI00041BBB38|nr:4-hydroxy-tetrahydrodipicolinate synthase [Anaerovorax odorimutans]